MVPTPNRAASPGDARHLSRRHRLPSALLVAATLIFAVTALEVAPAHAEGSSPLLLGLAAPFPPDALPDAPSAAGSMDLVADLHVLLQETGENVDELLFEGEFDEADADLEEAMRRVFADAGLLAYAPETADLAFSLGLAWVRSAESSALGARRLAELAQLFPAGVGRGTHPPSLLAELDALRPERAPLVLLADEGCTLDVEGLEVGPGARVPERLVRVAATCDGLRGPPIPVRASALVGAGIVSDGAGGLALSDEAAASLRALRDGSQVPPLPDALRAGHRSVRLAAEVDGERLVLYDDGTRLCASRGRGAQWSNLWAHAERCAALDPQRAAPHALTELVGGEPLPPAPRPLAGARWSLLAATAAAGAVATWATFDTLSLRSGWSACAEQVGCGDTGRFDLYEDLTRRRRRQAVALGATGAALGVTTTVVWRSTRPVRINPSGPAGTALSERLPAPAPGPPSGPAPLRIRR